MNVRRYARGVALAIALSLSVLSVGCYGKFQLTRMIYDLNRSVEDRYVRSAVTWAFLIVPVYGFSAFLDFAVFNVVEFWTGENPMLTTRIHRQGGETLSMTIARDGKETVAVLDRFRDGRRLSTLTVRDPGDGAVHASLRVGGVETRRSVARLLPDGSVLVDGRSTRSALSERHAPPEVSSVRARVEGVLSRFPRTRG